VPEELLEPELEESLPETFFFLPVLKSVSYQPLPFKRKAAAETSLLSWAHCRRGNPSVDRPKFSEASQICARKHHIDIHK